MRLLGCGVALIAEFCLPTKQRKALRSGHLARDLVADSLELLEHSGLSKRSWSHASTLAVAASSRPSVAAPFPATLRLAARTAITATPRTARVG